MDALLTLYKMFIKPLFKYAEIMYNKPNNELLKKIKKFNKKHILPLQKQLKKHIKKKFIKNLG